jgi:hypothetical protein
MLLTRKRSVSSAETDVVKPSDSDESPARRGIRSRARREDSQHDGRDREEQAVGKVSTDHRPPASDLVNAHYTNHLRDQCQDRRDSLVFQRVVGVNTHGRVNGLSRLGYIYDD